MSSVSYLTQEIEAAEYDQACPPRPRLDQYGYTLATGSPTLWRIKVTGSRRYYRVYALQFSNACSNFIRYKNRRLYLKASHFVAMQRLHSQATQQQES